VLLGDISFEMKKKVAEERKIPKTEATNENL
jgi:hypothetical protein